MHSQVLCYAEFDGAVWDAICLDFDVSAQGRSFEEARDRLHEAIELFLEGVAAMPAGERARFLRSRPAPFMLRLKVLLQLVAAALLVRRSETRTAFTQPVDGLAAPA